MKTDIRNTWIFKIPVAHRGLHTDTIPENSLASFQNAAEHGYPVELDVQLLKDGTIAVFHDKNLDRLVGRAGCLTDLTAREIKEARLLTRHKTVSDQHIPTLQEVLDFAEGKLPLMIEIKGYDDIEPYKPGKLEDALINILQGYKGEYAIISFNTQSLKLIKKGLPNVFLGLLCATDNEQAWDKLEFSKNDYDFIDYYFKVLPKQWISKHDSPIFSWTITNMEDYELAKKHSENYTFENFIPPSKP